MRFYKLLILPVLMMPFAMTDVAHAKRGTCGGTLEYSGSQDYDDDEYLYENSTQFERSKKGYENSDHSNSGDGRGYECDNDWCDYGTTKTMPFGHVFKGVVRNYKAEYKCYSGDYWMVTSMDACEGLPPTVVAKKKQDYLAVGYAFEGLTRDDCSGVGGVQPDTNGTEFKLSCREGKLLYCFPTKCIKGFKVSGDKCVPDTDVCNEAEAKKGTRRSHACFTGVSKYEGAATCFEQCTKTTTGDYQWVVLIDECDASKGYKCEAKYDDGIGCQKCVKKGSGGGGGGDGSSCYADPRRTNAELKGCCDLKSSEATPDWANGKCVCTDTNKKFAFDSKGKGTCVAKDAVVEKPKCDCSTKVTVITAATSACGSSNATVTQAITTINTECSKSSDQCDGTTYQQAVTVINEIIASGGCKTQPVEPKKPEINKQRLTEAITAIDKYRSGLDVSVWKDAEGNFNTARLVSDSIAGVVLGTAGGLITSSVVKKNQVKNGFEDVVCTIGGQTVGSYGDEISVGIK